MKKKETKIERFKSTVRINRKVLRDHFSVTTVNSWIYTDRIPGFDNAVKIAGILNMPISAIPYFEIKRG